VAKPIAHLSTYLSRDEVAERMGVSTKTVGRWIERSELPAHYFGRQIRIAEEDAVSFAAARRR
jgi:excisionase family DNA binding protein